jgi:hypothetical protein
VGQCCGQERTTKFCPNCGKPTRAGAGWELLAHIRSQIHSKEVRRKKVSSYDAGYTHRTGINENIAKWQEWERWVAAQLGPDYSPEYTGVVQTGDRREQA